MSSIETVRALVHSLRRRPDDEEGRSVLGDWCEEHGFEDAARVLRADLSNETLMTLAGLRMLFGEARTEEGDPGATVAPGVTGAPNTGRYTAAIGLYRREDRRPGSGRRDGAQWIEVGEDAELEAVSQVFLKVRRVMFSSSIASALEVSEIRVGIMTLLPSTDPLPGEMCLLSSPEFFEPQIAVPNQPIFVQVRNIADVRIRVSGCILGDQPTQNGLMGSIPRGSFSPVSDS